MTLAENVALPLGTYTDLDPAAVAELAEFKLALVGLAGFGGYYPSDISGGMRKRAAIARAMALDPEVLFLDEPSAGLDPISSRLLDDLILELRGSLGTTIVIVTHELASIFAVGDNSVFLDTETRTMIATRSPALAGGACRGAEGAHFSHPRCSGAGEMSRTASPRAIGLFVLGGIVLARARPHRPGRGAAVQSRRQLHDLFRQIAQGAAAGGACDLPRRRRRRASARSGPSTTMPPARCACPCWSRSARVRW